MPAPPNKNARLNGKLDDVVSLPTHSGGSVSVKVARLSSERADWWHRHIQPVINSDPTLAHRADRNWKWPRYLTNAGLTGWFLRQGPVALEISIDQARLPAIPIALLLMVMDYPGLPSGQDSPFLWYLSDAPQAALANHLPPGDIPKPIATAALDVALTRSFRAMMHGRLSLHADQTGGPGLVAWYNGKGMTQYPLGKKLPAVGRQLVMGNDGRYFYFDSNNACNFSHALDSWR